MKQPNPDKFVVTEGIPITVHSAGREREGGGREEEREGGRGEGRERGREKDRVHDLITTPLASPSVPGV